ncbi:MAG: tRNA (guanosine(46)-N7)-methyltransferase TrmB [Clostridia bacterium]|nr:tRNA (guanosine(46)-N7)-methyltransferase TrmB [Clostridia bacterium]
MRQRKKRNLDKRLDAASHLLVEHPEQQKGQWRALFEAPPEAKLMVELGCGKGTFVCESARREPDALFIAFDKVPEVLVMAVEKAIREGLTNVRFVLGDAALLEEFFEPGEFDRLYINFCDPWHKSRQAKRRLTHRNFLASYLRLLGVGGQIHFKTDNRRLFDFSVEEFEACHYAISELTYDLHATPAPWNIVTEYERTWSEKGYPINRLVATVTDETAPAPPRKKRASEAAAELSQKEEQPFPGDGQAEQM